MPLKPGPPIPGLFDPGAGGGEKAARCRACQLQLCKSRAVPPHPGLKEIGAKEIGASQQRGVTIYRCEDCGVTLMRSDDPAAAGWAAPRRAVVLARTTAEAGADAQRCALAGDAAGSPLSQRAPPPRPS